MFSFFPRLLALWAKCMKTDGDPREQSSFFTGMAKSTICSEALTLQVWFSFNLICDHLIRLADKFGAEIFKNMIAYVNIDGIVGNWFPNELVLSVSASPILADLLSDALVKTPSPIFGVAASALFDGTFDVLGDGNLEMAKKECVEKESQDLTTALSSTDWEFRAWICSGIRQTCPNRSITLDTTVSTL